MRVALITAFILTLGSGGDIRAQTSSVSGPPAQVTEEIAKHLVGTMASDLRNLVVAQESYFADNNRYGQALSATDRRQVFITPSSGVTLTLTYVTTNTWAGRATHEWLRWSCVIAVGQVAASRVPHTAVQGLSPKEEGAPICDDP